MRLLRPCYNLRMRYASSHLTWTVIYLIAPAFFGFAVWGLVGHPRMDAGSSAALLLAVTSVFVASRLRIIGFEESGLAVTGIGGRMKSVPYSRIISLRTFGLSGTTLVRLTFADTRTRSIWFLTPGTCVSGATDPIVLEIESRRHNAP